MSNRILIILVVLVIVFRGFILGRSLFTETDVSNESDEVGENDLFSYTVSYEPYELRPSYASNIGGITVYRLGELARQDYILQSGEQYKRSYYLKNELYACTTPIESVNWVCNKESVFGIAPILGWNPYSESFSIQGTSPVDSERILGFDARCFKQDIGVNYLINQTSSRIVCLHPTQNIVLKDDLRIVTSLSFESLPQEIFELPD